MIEESLFKKHFVGRDGFFWWMGQVMLPNTWTGNMPSGTQGSGGDLPGFKQRVKVRIMGYHTASFEQLPDEDLPWAYLMFPVTAGGGGGGMSCSSSFSGGEIVFGFFLDGEDGQQPVVMGVLDKSTQQTLSKDLPEAGFVPFSGYANGSVESRHNIKAGGGSGQVDKFAPPIPVTSTRPGGSQVQVQPTVRDESAVLEQPGLLGGDVETDGRQAAQQNADATGDVMPANPCPNDEPQSGIALEQKRLQKVTALLKSMVKLLLIHLPKNLRT